MSNLVAPATVFNPSGRAFTSSGDRQSLHVDMAIPRFQQHHPMQSLESDRGRERDREMPEGEEALLDLMEEESDKEMAEARPGEATTTMPGKRKRRRSRKGLGKKYECPHPGCGKSYSRAEHLYRHQLNRKAPPIQYL